MEHTVTLSPQSVVEIVNSITESWYVAYRKPESFLVNDWTMEGKSPTEPFATYQEAKDSADRLAKTMYYDVMILPCVYRMHQ